MKKLSSEIRPPLKMAKEIFSWVRSQLDELNAVLEANNYYMPRKYSSEPLGYARFEIDLSGTGIYDRFPKEIIDFVVENVFKNRISVFFFAKPSAEVAGYNPARNQMHFYIDPYDNSYFKKSELTHLKDVVAHELVHFMQALMQYSLLKMENKRKGIGSPETGTSIDDFYDHDTPHSLRPVEFYALLDTAARELLRELKKPLGRDDRNLLDKMYPNSNLEYANFEDLESKAKFEILFKRFKEFLFSNKVANEMKKNPDFYKKFSNELYKTFLKYLDKKNVYAEETISLLKNAIIKKEKGKYCVRSPKNKSWSGGCYTSKQKAEERLREVEVLKYVNKNKSDDGQISMAKDLENIAEYLESAGFVSDAKKIKDVAYILDSASDEDEFYIEDNAIDIPSAQMNVGGPVGGYNGSSGGGSPSLFSVDVGTVASKGDNKMFKIAGKYDHIDFKPPKSVADAAARGLELRKKNKGKGGLSNSQAKNEGVGSGVQRAVNLKNRTNMSPSTVKRMKAFFDRHQKNKKVEKGKAYHEDKGYIAWMLWGGDPGYSWAKKVVRQMEAADKKAKANVIAVLIKVANSLDEKGFYAEAGHADKIMREMHMMNEDEVVVDKLSPEDLSPEYGEEVGMNAKDGIPRWQYSKLKKLLEEGASFDEAKKEMPELLKENYDEMRKELE